MSKIYQKLEEYAKSNYYPFHMPGHKRNITQGMNPYQYDITEIDGFDNLHEPQGILRIAMEEAAKLYQSDQTYFLINGSTCGILSAICSVTKKGDKIAVARNSHKSVFHAMFLNELTPKYIYPEYIEEYGIYGGINPDSVQEILKEGNIKAVIITSPTYEGIVSDIQTIAKIVHEAEAVLIVDEAHGAHFCLGEDFPKSALDLGADLVIQSLHKTLPALTQTALLHVKGERVNKERLKNYLQIFQTSSPSYVLMASIDSCIQFIKTDAYLAKEIYVKRMNVIMQHAKKLTHIKIMGNEIIGKNGVYDRDLSKLVISVRKTSYTGEQLYETLNNKYHLQMEMAAKDYVIAMTSVMDSEDGLLRLFTAIAEIDRDIRLYGKREECLESNWHELRAIVLSDIAKAQESDFETIPIKQAFGKISCEYVYLYPPGIPIIAPGEMITKDCIMAIESLRASGLDIHGTIDKQAYNVRVMKENFKGLEFK